MRDGVVVAIPATELAVGDVVVVYPGEMIPVDGEIIDGHAMIDQKTITGEGLPVMRGKGEAGLRRDRHPRGPDSRSARIRVGAATTAGQIAHLVESAPIGDTRMQNHAERFADRLVMPTLALATGTAARHRRLQSLPVAGDRRLRHRHPRRRADRRAGLDDACGARRHHHQERRPYGEARRGRHRRSSTRPAR